MAGKRLEVMQADEVNHLFKACKKAYKEYADWYGALKLHGNPPSSSSVVSSLSAVSPFSFAQIQENKIKVGTVTVKGVLYTVYSITRKGEIYEKEIDPLEADQLMRRIQKQVNTIEEPLNNTLITDKAIFKIQEDKSIITI